MKLSIETYQNFLHDLGYLLKEEAIEAKQEYDKFKPNNPDQYTIGRLIAWYTVISLIQQEAAAFGIPLQELRLDDIDPERDLI